MKKISLLLLLSMPILAISQVQQYSAKRILADDSLYVNGRWIRKITTNLNSPDSNSHNMLPTNRAVMDMIKQGGGSIPALPTGRLAFGGPTNQLDNSDSLFYNRSTRTLNINKGASDQSALRILQPSGTGIRPWLRVDPPINNDSTLAYEWYSQLNANDDGTISNHVVKDGFNITGAKPQWPRWWDARESHWRSGGLLYLERIWEAQCVNGENVRVFMHTFTGGQSLATSNNVIDMRGNSFNFLSMDNTKNILGVGYGQMQLFNSGNPNTVFQMLNGANVAQFQNNGVSLLFSGLPFVVQGNLNLQTQIISNTERSGIRVTDDLGFSGFIINHGSNYPTVKYRRAVIYTGSHGNNYQGALAIFNNNQIQLGDVEQVALSTDKINFAGTTRFQNKIKADSFAVGSNTDSVIVRNTATKELRLVHPSVLSGITSINSQTGPAITITSGTSGTDVGVNQLSNTITVNVPSASPSARGVVTTTSQSFIGQKTFGEGLIISGTALGGTARVQITGNNTAGALSTIGAANIRVDPMSYTDGTTAGGTTLTTQRQFNLFGAATIAATNTAVTYDDLANVAIREVVPGTNVTITRPRSLAATGISQLDMVAHTVTEANGLTASLGKGGHFIFTGTTCTATLPVLAEYRGAIYYIKNAGSGDLTVQRAGSDQLYDTSAVNSITIAAGTSRIIVAGQSFWYVE